MKAEALWVRAYSVVLLAISALLVIGGGYLTSLGGSLYYLLWGVALCVSAVLLWRHRGEGVLLYALTFVATLIWSLWEAGYDPWAWLPRLLLPTVLGLVLLIHAVRRGLTWRIAPWSTVKVALALLVASR